jgi:hypothetical protein
MVIITIALFGFNLGQRTLEFLFAAPDRSRTQRHFLTVLVDCRSLRRLNRIVDPEKDMERES